MSVNDPLRRAADELEIRNIIARLAMLADEGDVHEYASLFTTDARWELHTRVGTAMVQSAVVCGRAELVAAAQERRRSKITGPGSNTRHAVLSSAVTIGEDAASARSYYVFYRNTDTDPEVVGFGIYTDEFRRMAEGWRLARRRIDPG